MGSGGAFGKRPPPKKKIRRPPPVKHHGAPAGTQLRAVGEGQEKPDERHDTPDPPRPLRHPLAADIRHLWCCVLLALALVACSGLPSVSAPIADSARSGALWGQGEGRIVLSSWAAWTVEWGGLTLDLSVELVCDTAERTCRWYLRTPWSAEPVQIELPVAPPRLGGESGGA